MKSERLKVKKKTSLKVLWLPLSTLILCIGLSGCQAFERQQKVGATVELNGHYLYRSTLDSLSLGLDSVDSVRVTQQYIRQWAQDILLYDNAISHKNELIEAMVTEYRLSLYAQAYEERLVDLRMSKEVADTAVQAIYDQMPDRFKLDESIMKGVLVVIPKDAPNVPKLRQWLQKVGVERIEDVIQSGKSGRKTKAGKDKAANVLDDIEKYVYQNASGYELFTDKWMTTTEMLRQLPMERAELESKLKYSNRIEVANDEKTYILQITDKHMRGEAMPIEYARPQIEKIVLNARQVEFLKSERERMYQEAIDKQQLKFYE